MFAGSYCARASISECRIQFSSLFITIVFVKPYLRRFIWVRMEFSAVFHILHSNFHFYLYIAHFALTATLVVFVNTTTNPWKTFSNIKPSRLCFEVAFIKYNVVQLPLWLFPLKLTVMSMLFKLCQWPITSISFYDLDQLCLQESYFLL